jgi:hypothetical protein
MKVDYFDINANNINDITSIYVKDENKDKLTKLLASNFTKHLLELDLSDCFYLKGILPISKCKNLKKIILNNINIKSIDNIYKCSELKYLYISLKFNIVINLSKFSNFNNIEYIELNRCNIIYSEFFNDEGDYNNTYLELTKLHTLILNNICILSIGYDSNMLITNIFNILRSCSNLKILKIRLGFYYENIDNIIIDNIEKLCLLEELELSNMNLNNFKFLNKLKNLKKLTVSKIYDKKINFPKKLNIIYVEDY